MWNGITIIAEVKTISPFGYSSDKPWDELFEKANEIGDIISIHTDKRWGGSLDLLKKARNLTKKPILAKGIHESDEDIKKCLEIGADYILVVGRIPSFSQENLLIEPNSLEELSKIPSNLRGIWNSRDLKTGGFKDETFENARAIFSGWLCQASNIKSVQDIKTGANAILVGTNLLNFANSIKVQV